MSLQKLLDEGSIRPHTTSIKEISDLIHIVARDLADAEITQLSADRRFATAYNAALQLATIVLHAGGFRTAKQGHHHTTFAVLPDIMGTDCTKQARYFDRCRRKRNATDYNRAGAISADEVEEIVKTAKDFKFTVLKWLDKYHPGFVPEID